MQNNPTQEISVPFLFWECRYARTRPLKRFYDLS